MAAFDQFDPMDLAEIQELTNLCFKSNSYIQNFPQVFKPQNSDYFIQIRNDNQLVSFCTIYTTYFHYGNHLLKGFCIGSVCTHPNFQNKGFATKILQMAESKARLMQGNFLFLFSEKNPLYEKAGYQLCGQTYMAEITAMAHNSTQALSDIKILSWNFSMQSPDGITPSPGLTGGSSIYAKIWSFIIQHSSAYESLLSYLEFLDLIKIKNMQLYYLINEEKICSVCFLNKGDDFDNVIHGIYYSHVEYAFMLIANIQSKKIDNKKLYFFPGAFFADFTGYFDYQVLPGMYTKELDMQGMKMDQIFVRSLQGT